MMWYRLLLLAVLLPALALCQPGISTGLDGYPRNNFRNPLDIPIFLAGNFGECRPGHFHSGIDIKTLGEENQPVHAAADGYVSRIKMEKGGFGHGLYITHPNGYTTLYAHLNNFAPEIQKYVKRKQYENQRWDVDLQFVPNQFPVKKGQLIAYSGNTGASTAPHLHFEIRNTYTEHPLNPELFGLPISDTIAPVPSAIAVYAGGVYDNGDKLPEMIALKKSAGQYHMVNRKTDAVTVLNDTIIVASHGNVGIGLTIDDYMQGSDNTLAHYKGKLYLDDAAQAEVVLDDIGYDVTRYINAYADYKVRKLTGKWVQCFFQLPGNRLDVIFKQKNTNRGRLSLADGKAHKLTVEIQDDLGNLSTVSGWIRNIAPQSAPPEMEGTPFYAGKVNEFKNENVSLTMNERQLYDNFYFQFKKTPYKDGISDQFQVHYAYVPVHEHFELHCRAGVVVQPELQHKVVLFYNDGKSTEGSAATYEQDRWFKCRVRDFGIYWLGIDTIPPVIKSLQKNNAMLTKAKQILFTVTDNATSVRTFSGYLDGNWICFEQHGSSFFYTFDEHCSKGKHKLVFKAEDENGNPAQYELNFTR